MKKITFIAKTRNEGASFFSAVSTANETAYLILMTIYVALYMILKVAWSNNAEMAVDIIRLTLVSLVMWGSAIYLLYVIALWKNLLKNTLVMILLAAVVLLSTFYFTQKMSTNLYGAVMDVFFCLMACGKNFKKILKCILGTTAFTLVFAFIGIFAGYAVDVVKPENIHPGHSLGIEYPNNWGYLVFLVLILIWYLYLRHKPVITFTVFWAASAVMIFYIYCRTIAFFSLTFPVLALFIDWVERRADRKDENKRLEINHSENRGQRKKLGVVGWIVVAIPILAFAFMLFTSMQYEWVHDHFYYTWFHNFAMRFVQGGLYFKTYGFPLIGNPYRSNVSTFVNINNDFIEVGVLDSSFAAYMIMRGMIWLAYTLLWLCLAHWKAVKKRNYAIILISSFMLFFAMLERPGLEACYNFVLFYPLAKVVSKEGTEKVLEFPDSLFQKKTEEDTILPETILNTENL